MRKIIIGISIIMIGCIAWAIPTNDTDIALGITKAIRTTFENTGGCFDGVISSDPQFSAKSGDLYNIYQQIFVELPKPFYVRQIKIYWDKASYYPNYNILISADGVSLFELDAARKEETEGDSLIHTYDLPGALVASMRLAIKGEKRDKVKKGPVIIQEIEIFPQMDDRVEIGVVEETITDTEAFIYPELNIQARPIFMYKEAGSDEAYKQGGYGNLGEAASAVSLNPGTRYDYFVKVVDFNANYTDGPNSTFTTKQPSLAKDAKITGTFQQNVDNAGQNALTDSSLKDPIDSGSIYDKDQEIVLDLGGSKQVSSVFVFWRRLAYSKNYSILGSQDGKEWITLGEKIDASKVVTSRSFGSKGGSPMKVVETNFDQRPLRYIKVLVPKDSDFYHKHSNWDYVQVYEVKVF